MKDRIFSVEETAERSEQSRYLHSMFSQIAKDYGYAIAFHGSGVRDCDLIAVPWTDSAVSAEELVVGIASRMILTLGHGAYDKPHGRFAIAMWDKDYPDHQIDFSIMPRKIADA